MSTGMLLGKFLPPHNGHRYLVDFARHFCDDLTVLLCTLPSEPIPGSLRFAWMKQLFPGCRVIHNEDILPQEPEEHPDFWQLWHDSIRRRLPSGPDIVFASEEYGKPLAALLGARFVPVDIAREQVPISGTAIRRDPMRNWEYIPIPVRPWYLRKVCIFGPESTGKTTLASRLAEHFQTRWVAEYARTWLEYQSRDCQPEDMRVIAKGQLASERAMSLHANKLLFCDTDLLTTNIWSQKFWGIPLPKELLKEAEEASYDLTLLCDVDVPWVDDSQRYFPEGRREFFDICEAELIRCGRKYLRIHGDWEQRWRQSVEAVELLLKSPGYSFIS